MAHALPTPETPSGDTGASPDGRHRRSALTRKRIVTALTALVSEGAITPTAEMVSLRADVGLRTVFRHFDDMETLYREMNTEFDAILAAAMRAPLAAASWQDRLQESVTLRAALFERLAPYYVGTQVHRHESPFLNAQLVRAAVLHRDQVRRMLPPALADDPPRFEALLLVLSIDAWLRLRREQGLDLATATTVVQTLVGTLIGAAPDRPQGLPPGV